MKLRPRKGTALILPDTSGESSGMIVLPEKFKGRELPDRGRVVAMSGKPITKKGVVTDAEFKIGDRVLVKKFTGLMVNFEGVQYFSVPIHEVMAVLT